MDDLMQTFGAVFCCQPMSQLQNEDASQKPRPNVPANVNIEWNNCSVAPDISFKEKSAIVHPQLPEKPKVRGNVRFMFPKNTGGFTSSKSPGISHVETIFDEQNISELSKNTSLSRDPEKVDDYCYSLPVTGFSFRTCDQLDGNGHKGIASIQPITVEQKQLDVFSLDTSLPQSPLEEFYREHDSSTNGSYLQSMGLSTDELFQDSNPLQVNSPTASPELEFDMDSDEEVDLSIHVIKNRPPIRDVSMYENSFKTLTGPNAETKVYSLVGSQNHQLSQNLSSPLNTWNVHQGKENVTISRAVIRPFFQNSFSCQANETNNSDQLNQVPVTVLPEEYRSIFSFPFFNIVQSKAFNDIFYTDKPVVVCAPTGSGKTAILELSIVRLMMQTSSQESVKVVYLAPIKALCNERFKDWSQKFGPLGLNCVELTGDSDVDDYVHLQHASIITTTPEKWDSITRRWRDNKSLVQMVKLFLIDEVHIVNDDQRGATVEAVISRMKTVQASLHREHEERLLRFVAVSATIPNTSDIAEWLGSTDDTGVTHKMGDDLRPVKLNKIVLGFACQDGTNEFQFDISLSYKLSWVISKYSEGKPSLVFCNSRKGAVQAAGILSKMSKFVRSAQHKQQLVQAANTLRDNKLRDAVVNGIGFHHAGLELTDRRLIEELFVTATLPVLVSTSTLALGVNFPAHLVVVKGTSMYDAGGVCQYSDMQILQMIGRAGRPQFDTTATAVIMTKCSLKGKYESFVNGNQMLESSLHRNLIEHLNSEIVLQTISDVSIAMEWIKSTFFYIRVMKNPKHYGISTELTKEKMEKKLVDLCVKELNGLAKYKMIHMDDDCFDLKPLEPGRLMARYYVTFETMKSFTTLRGNENLQELVTLISGCKEFRSIQLRTNDKKTLNLLNKNKESPSIRFPLDGRFKSSSMKVNCLIQAAFGCLAFQDFSLIHETNTIMRNGQRLAKCLAEYLAFETKGFRSFLSAVILAKCFRARLWENSKHVTRQLDKIGITLSSAIVSAGMHSFEQIENSNPREIEMIVNRHPPFGNEVRDAAIHLPKYFMAVEQIQERREMYGIVKVCISLSIVNSEILEEKWTAPRFNSCLLVVGDADNTLLMKKRIFDSTLLRSGQWTTNMEITRPRISDEIRFNLINEYYVGLDIQKTFTPLFSGQKRLCSTQPSTQKQKRNLPDSENDGADLPDGWRQCHHNCHNKITCGHECCKMGCHEKKQRQVVGIQRDLNEIGLKARLMPQVTNIAQLTSSKSSSTIDLQKLESRFAYVQRKNREHDPGLERNLSYHSRNVYANNQPKRQFPVEIGTERLPTVGNFCLDFDLEGTTVPESKVREPVTKDRNLASQTSQESSDCIIIENKENICPTDKYTDELSWDCQEFCSSNSSSLEDPLLHRHAITSQTGHVDHESFGSHKWMHSQSPYSRKTIFNFWHYKQSLLGKETTLL